MRALIVLVALLVVGCASTPPYMSLGIQRFNEGRLDESTILFKWALQQQGIVEAYHNLGVVEERRGNQAAAIAYFEQAARYGIPESITALRRLGRAVPDTDKLDELRAAQAARQEQQDAQSDAAASALVAILNGVALYQEGRNEAQRRSLESMQQRRATAPALAPPAPTARTATTPRPATPITAAPLAPAAPLAAAPSAPNATRSCTSDYGCRYGERCIKPLFRSEGVCMREIDAGGLPTLNPPSPNSVGVETIQKCRVAPDCPVGFACDPQRNACVKLN